MKKEAAKSQKNIIRLFGLGIVSIAVAVFGLFFIRVYLANPDKTEDPVGLVYRIKGRYYRRKAKSYDNKRKYKHAVTYYKKVRHIVEADVPDGHPDLIAIDEKLADIYGLQGKYEEAIKGYETLLDMMLKEPMVYQAAILNIYEKLVHIYPRNGQAHDPIWLYKRLVNLYSKLDKKEQLRQNTMVESTSEEGNEVVSLSSDHLAIKEQIECLHAIMGDFFYKRGDYKRGYDTYNKAIRMHMEQGKSEDLLVADYKNKRALILYNQKNYEEAEAQFKEALRIRLALLSPDHIDIIAIEGHLALILFVQGDVEAAQGKTLEVLEKLESTVGQDHPQVAATYNSLGMMAYSEGDLPQAHAYYERALVILDQADAGFLVQLAGVKYNMAEIFIEEKKYQDALAYTNEIIDIYEQKLYAEHPNLGKVYRQKGYLKQVLGDYKQAKKFFEKARAIFAHYPKNMAQEIGLIERHLGDIELAARKYEKAIKCYEKALRILAPYLSPGDSEREHIEEKLREVRTKLEDI